MLTLFLISLLDNILQKGYEKSSKLKQIIYEFSYKHLSFRFYSTNLYIGKWKSCIQLLIQTRLLNISFTAI